MAGKGQRHGQGSQLGMAVAVEGRRKHRLGGHVKRHVTTTVSTARGRGVCGGTSAKKGNKPTASSSLAGTGGFLQPRDQGGTSKLLSHWLTVLMARNVRVGLALLFPHLLLYSSCQSYKQVFLIPSMGTYSEKVTGWGQTHKGDPAQISSSSH